MTLKEIHNQLDYSKYSTLYIKIINNAINLNRIKLRKENVNYIYYEAHHILPKSLFKEYSNFKNNLWNKVLLTAREHFICHYLLQRHYNRINNSYNYNKMSHAFKILSNTRNYNSKLYEKAKLNLGHTKETKEKIRISSTGRLHTDKVKEKISNTKLQNPHIHTAEAKEKIRLTSLGRIQSEETKLKRSKSLTGIKRSSETKSKMSDSQSKGKNPSAKIIHFFDDKDNLMFISNGNFIETCKVNNLPHNPFKKSYQNNTKLFQTKISITHAKKKGHEIYKDWYAIVI